LGTSPPTVRLWRGRYLAEGIEGLYDRARSGRPAVVNEAMVVAATLTPPPAESGLTHWSSRELAKRIGVSHNEIASIWRRWELQPHRTESFKFSTDPELEAKIADIVGLYLDPPHNAVVLCIDEKSQVQALERARPMLPVAPGLAERRSYDYLRHGTTSLFAALDVATGKVTQRCYPRHTNKEFLAFLKQVAAEYPEGDMHIVVDNYGTHTHPNVTAWLARPKNQRITLHFTPTGCSWLNMVEVFFSIITRKAIRRGSFTSIAELITAIEAFIASYNTPTANHSSGPNRPT
jgi:transposase